VDWSKLWVSKRWSHEQVLFILDQVVHLGLLVALAFWLGFPTLHKPEWLSLASESSFLGTVARVYLNPEVIGIILAYTISLFFGVIWVQLYAMGKDSVRFGNEWLTPGERWTGAIERGLFTSALWLGSWPMLLLSIMLSLAAYYFKWKVWMSPRFFLFRSGASYILAGLVGLLLRFLEK
jgi:hypothetical protein